MDVAVVGAGFLGLSTAIHLAERGAKVAVVEAHEPGAGSSGRNTGFVIPNFPSPLGPGAAIDAFGTEAGEWLVTKVGNAADFVFQLTERLGIACEQDQIGWAQAAHAEEMLDGLARYRHKDGRRTASRWSFSTRTPRPRFSASPVTAAAWCFVAAGN